MKKRYTEEQIIGAIKRHEGRPLKKVVKPASRKQAARPHDSGSSLERENGLPFTHNRQHNREDLIGQVVLNQG